jgi:hypothetical protein
MGIKELNKKGKLSVIRAFETINVYKGHDLVAIKPIGKHDPLEVYRAVVNLYEANGYIVNEHLEVGRAITVHGVR